MAIPENLKKEVEQKVIDFLKTQLPKINPDMVRLSYKFRGNNLTIFEERRSFYNPFDPDKWTPFPVAQMRYDPKRRNGLYISLTETINGLYMPGEITVEI